MFFENQKFILILALALTFLSACGGTSPSEISAPPELTVVLPTSEAIDEPAVGIANPASVHCEEQGGSLEIRTGQDGGQYGVCIFPDRSECEEWAFFRGECLPGASMNTPTPQHVPAYINDMYGFSLDPPGEWAIEGYDAQNYVRFRRSAPDGTYFLFVGYIREGEERPPFRTGMPSGEFVDGGTFTLLGQQFPRKYLVFEGSTKVVDYGSNLQAGGLRLFIYLDPQGVDGQEYSALNIPLEIIAEADGILATFMLQQ